MLAAVSLAGAAQPRARVARHAARRAGITVAAQSAGAAFPIGSRVRVKDAIVVYHVPKQKTGLTLQARPRTRRAAPRVLAVRYTRSALAGLARLPRCRAAWSGQRAPLTHAAVVVTGHARRG